MKHLFSLPEEGHYINCAYMSPLLKSVEEAGIKGIQRKRFPIHIGPSDYFTEVQAVRALFGQLINAPAAQIALVPSSSYGLANAVMNIPTAQGTHIVMVGDEFPSDFFTAKRWCDRYGKALNMVAAPSQLEHRGQIWNEAILSAIQPETAAVVMSPVHWIDGTKFDMIAISKRCREMNAFLILDGTQMIGASSFDVSEIQPDALVCAGYKWLFGPYSTGIAYYSEKLLQGIPIEESWMNRANAQDFSGLTNYCEEYGEGAARFNVGETSNFILMPMLKKALENVLEWGVDRIEAHNAALMEPMKAFCNGGDYRLEEDTYRANHLYGLYLKDAAQIQQVATRLRENQIYVSVRSTALRISPHLYNSMDDIHALIKQL